jgi:hypothetical protein
LGIVIAGGKKLNIAGTVTVELPDEYPGAVAVMVVMPILTPFTDGVVAGTVDPAGIKRVLGLTVAVSVLLLVSVTVTPPGGAGVPSVTGSGTDSSTPTVTLGIVMPPAATTVMFMTGAEMSGEAA